MLADRQDCRKQLSVNDSGITNFQREFMEPSLKKKVKLGVETVGKKVLRGLAESYKWPVSGCSRVGKG